MIGQTLGHYRIVEKIGSGGMGVVYRARDERLDRDVALKVLPGDMLADETARARLLNEARIASALNHPHICTIHEVGEADGQSYIAMEYVEGRPLKAVVPRDGLPVEAVLRYGSEIADALAHAHERGIVHRDLKSSNVVITPDGRAKVLDFGLAKRLQNEELAEATRSRVSLTEAGAVVGTLHYLAPELLRGEPADARSDVWALGVVLYEMATGRLPFQGGTGFELSSAILREPPTELPPRVPAGLRATIQRCLAKEPAHRYQRASEVRAVLEAIPSHAAVVPAAAPARPHTLARGWLLVLALALVVLLVVLFGLNVGGSRDRLLGRAVPTRIESLAVLPLANLSGDAEQDYFADGMTEALITDLAQISALRVISRTSVMRYKGTRKSVPEIGRELNVHALMEGSVQRSGDRVRITAQLIHAPSDRHLWAESYERDLHDILALQREVARAIASEIKIKLTPQEQLRLASARPVNPAAHEAYLKGRFYWNKFSLEGVNKSIEYFQQAIQLDPSYALAYAGLADSYSFLGAIGELAPPREAMPKASAAARMALEIDETLVEAHIALALVKLNYDWDWSAAQREFQRALELNPSHADAHHWYSHYLSAMGRFDESWAASKRALELDPLNLAITIHLGCHYIYARQYDQAIDASQKTVEMDPNFWWARYFLGVAYEQRGAFAQAVAELDRARSIEAASRTLAALGHAYAVSGKRGEALKLLDELRELSKRRYVSPFDFAVIYAGLGEKDQAFAWLEKAHAERSGWLVYLKVEPRLDNLRSDPRFQGLLRRVGLPE